MEVVRSCITNQVQQRQPAEKVETVDLEQQRRLYCFTRIKGGQALGRVIHIWLRSGYEVARVELPVGSPDWRTWSSKTILPQWKGNWHVEIRTPSGTLLKRLQFLVR